MKLKISGTFEGKCSVCKKKSTVFTAGDEDSHNAVSVCKSCADNMGSKPLSDVIEQYGKKDDEPFKEGVKISGKGKAG